LIPVNNGAYIFVPFPHSFTNNPNQNQPFEFVKIISVITSRSGAGEEKVHRSPNTPLIPAISQTLSQSPINPHYKTISTALPPSCRRTPASTACMTNARRTIHPITPKPPQPPGAKVFCALFFKKALFSPLPAILPKWAAKNSIST
jgi:hypothetical protein